MKDLGIALQELQPGFSRFLSNARTQNDHPAAGERLVSSRPNIERMRERHRVTQIVRFRSSARPVLVHENNLASHPLHHQGIACSRPHEPAADDAYFHRNPPKGVLRKHLKPNLA